MNKAERKQVYWITHKYVLLSLQLERLERKFSVGTGILSRGRTKHITKQINRVRQLIAKEEAT